MCTVLDFVLCFVLVVVVYRLMASTFSEGFTSSGISMSNQCCGRLVSTYYLPSRLEDRQKNINMICGTSGRKMVQDPSRNYFVAGNELI